MNLKLIFVIVHIVTMKSIFSLTQKPKDPSADLTMLLQIPIGQFFNLFISLFLVILFHSPTQLLKYSETEKVRITIITTMNY